MNLRTSHNQTIVTEAAPIASGGEGAVYRILQGSTPGRCVKVFGAAVDAGAKEPKLKALIELARRHPAPAGAQFTGCWPEELVYDNGRFVGFIMPLAVTGSVELYELARLDIDGSISTEFLRKYDRKTATGAESRLKLCLNIAAAVHYFHSLGAYTFVDFKPQNVLVTPGGKITLIDLDSAQIANNGRVQFPALVRTPEYTPPEGQQAASDHIQQTWDRFALAVVLYEVLIGLHPYTATFGGKYQAVNTLTDAIQSDLFVFGSNEKYVSCRPKPHDKFYDLPPDLQVLFVAAFSSNAQYRPDASEWGTELYRHLQGQTGGVRTRPTATPRPLPQTPGSRNGISGPWIVAIVSVFLLMAALIASNLPATNNPADQTFTGDREQSTQDETGRQRQTQPPRPRRASER